MGNRNNLISKIKSVIVLSSLRGEDFEFLSSAHGVSISDISGRSEEFIENGTIGYKRKLNDSRISNAECIIGQLQMDLEFVKKEQIGIISKNIAIELVNDICSLTSKPYSVSLILKVGYSRSIWY